jgi:hypothetical protein
MKLLDTINEEISEKDFKKAAMLYKVLKKGIVIFDMETGKEVSDETKDTAKFSYTLSDKYEIRSFIDSVYVVPNRIYLKEENIQARNYYTKPVTNSIVRKFRQFGIDFIVPTTLVSIEVEPYKDTTN